QRIVLDVTNHVLVLGPLDELRHELSCQNRVFPQIFKIASVARLTCEVNAAAERHVETLRTQFLSNERAIFVGGIHVPTRSRGKIAWQRSRVSTILSAGPNAVGRVGHLNSRNSHSWNSDHVSCATVRTRRQLTH